MVLELGQYVLDSIINCDAIPIDTGSRTVADAKKSMLISLLDYT